MDLSFDPQDEAFRAEARAFLKAKLPATTAEKVTKGYELTRPEIMHWHRTLHAQGWLAPNWPKESGGPGWTVTQQSVYDEEATLPRPPPVIAFRLPIAAPGRRRFGTQCAER